jgi:hypothetical protein
LSVERRDDNALSSTAGDSPNTPAATLSVPPPPASAVAEVGTSADGPAAANAGELDASTAHIVIHVNGVLEARR